MTLRLTLPVLAVLTGRCRDEDDSAPIPEDSDSPAVDEDGDGYTAEEDCDDGDAAVNPGEREVCDADDQDEDCDGVADDADSNVDAETYASGYSDWDRDGYGDPGTQQRACTLPTGLIEVAGDCDDGDDSVYPGAEEDCFDAVKNDCTMSDEDADALCADAVDLTSGDAAYRLLGVTEGESTGNALAPAGDTDGDGVQDMIIGAYGHEPNGAARIVRGPILPSTTMDDAALTMTGVEEYGQTAEAVAGGGDVDGDGYDDVLVGGPSVDGTLRLAGAAYLVEGPSAGVISLADAGARIYGAVDYDGLGAAVALAGDVDGDGLSDVLVGAPPAAYNEGAAAYLLSGPLSGDVSAASATASITHDEEDDHAGIQVTGGDLNGDGLSDVVISATGGEHRSRSPGVWIGYGPLDGASTMESLDVWLSDEHTNDEAGQSIAANGDANGDGYADLLIGANGVSSVESYAGAAYLMLGPIARSEPVSAGVAQLQGSEQLLEAGSAVAFVGDLNGDGDDALVVNECMKLSTTDAGAAYVFEGPVEGVRPLPGAELVIEGEATLTYFAATLAGVGDVDDDGTPDLAIGAYHETNALEKQGAVYIFNFVY